ncbi:hypothetical protein LINPERPRIM_LOCUS12742 [Linum perenne]
MVRISLTKIQLQIGGSSETSWETLSLVSHLRSWRLFHHES